jgi:hypothetical protein
LQQTPFIDCFFHIVFGVSDITVSLFGTFLVWLSSPTPKRGRRLVRFCGIQTERHT